MNYHPTLKNVLAPLGLFLALANPISVLAVEEPGELPLEELRTFADVFNQIRIGYVEEIDDSTLLEEADEEPMPHLKPLRAWITFAIGLLLLIASSRMLVWGAVDIAGELGVSKMVIGLTVVAVGTSLPELAATIASALRGHAEIALGNVIGSNLFNLLAVMSIPGLIAPEILDPAVMTRDYPAMTVAMLLLALGIYVGRRRNAAPAGHTYIGRSIGMLLVSLYAMYYYWLFLTI